MKYIWLLEWRTETEYDCLQGAVVISEDEERARREIAGYCGDECQCGPNTKHTCQWLKSELASCDKIGVAIDGTPNGVILRDFRAG